MQQRPIGDRTVSAIGLGEMPLSIEGRPDRRQAIATIHASLDAGVTIIDTADAPAAAPYFPIVLASTTDFVHPFTMTFPGRSDPAHRLFPQIKVQHLVGAKTNVPDDELWGSDNPAVPEN